MSLYLEDIYQNKIIRFAAEKSFLKYLFLQREIKKISMSFIIVIMKKLKIQNLTQIYLLFLNKIKVLIT